MVINTIEIVLGLLGLDLIITKTVRALSAEQSLEQGQLLPFYGLFGLITRHVAPFCSLEPSELLRVSSTVLWRRRTRRRSCLPH